MAAVKAGNGILRKITGASVFVLSAPVTLYPLLHVVALWRIWGSASQPAHWGQNLVIAFCIGVLGGFGMYEGVRLYRSQPRVKLVY